MRMRSDCRPACGHLPAQAIGPIMGRMAASLRLTAVSWRCRNVVPEAAHSRDDLGERAPPATTESPPHRFGRESVWIVLPARLPPF